MCTISRQENDLNLKTNLMQSLVVSTSHSFPHSWLITGLVTRLTRWVPLVDQELLTPLEHPGSSRVLVEFSLLDLCAMCMLCRSLFVLLYVLFWPLCCLSFFDLRILITPLVSSNSSYIYYLFISVVNVLCLSISVIRIHCIHLILIYVL
jgi:hypothetical protein